MANDRIINRLMRLLSSINSHYVLALIIILFHVATPLNAATTLDPNVPGIAGTKHNLSMYGPGEVQATVGGTTQICVFCHTPHNSSPSGALWNREDSGATYTTFERHGTVLASLGQPDGGSKLCLSCHDGTIAVGSLLNLPGASGLAGTIEMSGVRTDAPAGALLPTSPGNITTDLSDDHPVSFIYSDPMTSSGSLELNPAEFEDPSTMNWVTLDSNNKVQCTSCHDPHSKQNSKFLVTDYGSGSPICAECHNKHLWTGAAHQTSQAVWNGTAPNPWHLDLGPDRNNNYTDDTPEVHGCFSCHKTHGGQAGKALTKDQDSTGVEEGTCLVCHNGNVASKDISTVYSKFYTHPTTSNDNLHYRADLIEPSPTREVGIDYSYVYDRQSNLTYVPDRRHAECVDCHNPHVAKQGNHTTGGLNGNVIGDNLLGSWGVEPTPWGIAGAIATLYNKIYFTDTTPLPDKVEGYLCLKCHSYYAYSLSPPETTLPDGTLISQSDLTASLNPANEGFHPVFELGKNQPPVGANSNWPISKPDLTSTFQCMVDGNCDTDGVTHLSTITCSDCHGSDVDTDPKGPHGSANRWILKGNETPFAASPQNFCYNCHRRDVYGDEGFADNTTQNIYANYSRVSHPVDGLGNSSPFYLPGLNSGNDGNKYGNLCLSCHGGAYDTANNIMDGIHGSNKAAGASGDPLGYRLMNGACVESYARPATTLSTGSLVFRTVDILTDGVCNSNFTAVTIPTTVVNYNCNSITDCIN